MLLTRRTPHQLTFVLILGMLGLPGCGGDAPTQPETPIGESRHQMLSAARNTWTPRAPMPFGDRQGDSWGTAPNAAGESIVYRFGGTTEEHQIGLPVEGYNVATDTWFAGLSSKVSAFDLNGVGKIGSRLYFSGGSNDAGTVSNWTNSLWAFDYTHDRMIRKADMPIKNGVGVTAVLGGKLYVLPATCSADYYPRAGDCRSEPNRRLYRYDPQTHTWVSRRQAPHYHWHGAAGAIRDKLYVVGGKTREFGPDVAALDVYDPKSNTWRTLAPLPIAGAASGAVMGGQFYVVVVNQNTIRTYAYNPKSNNWVAKATPDFSGSLLRVSLDGRSVLLMVSEGHTALYTP